MSTIKPSFGPTTAARTTGPSIPTPSAEDLKGSKSAKDLGTDYKLASLAKDASAEDVEKALAELVGDKKGKGYAFTAECLGKSFKGRALEGIQKEMGQWLKANPNATQAQVFEQASKTMMKHVLMNQQFKQTIDQMASAAISRMRDTFEG